MATAAEIGATSSNYTGNANLGGGTFGAVQLDTRPLMDLARYTMLFNKAEYDQRQKDAERAADEIAAMTNYDLTSGIPKDAKALQDKYEKLTNYVRDNPNALDYRNKKEWAEYKKLRNELDNDLNGAKIRNTMWALRQKEIQDQKDPELKRIMQQELDDEIAATDIRTPLRHSHQYRDRPVVLPDAAELSFDVVKTGPNTIGTRQFKLFNVAQAKANGATFALDLDRPIDESTPEGQRQAVERKNNFFVQGAQAFNSVINKTDGAGNFLYKTKHTDANGNVTYKVDQSKLSQLPKGVYSLVTEYNNYITKQKEEILSGTYTDAFEKPVTFGPGALNLDDYNGINVDDGISSEELAVVAQYAKWKGDSYTTDVKLTDNQIQRAQLDETIRHNKATEGLQAKQLQQQEQRWKDSMTGAETVKNGAMERAKRIYEDLRKLADTNGFISPEKIRQLNQEQRKYLGVEKLVESETGSVKSMFVPLDVKYDKKNPVGIQLVNGEIKVLKGASPIEGGRRYVGQWDNERSTNLFNVATNILNEELRIAGAKELNAYMPIDLGTGGISENQVGGTSTQSGGDRTNTSTTTNNVPVNNTGGGGKWEKYKVNE